MWVVVNSRKYVINKNKFLNTNDNLEHVQFLNQWISNSTVAVETRNVINHCTTLTVVCTRYHAGQILEIYAAPTS